MSWNLLRSAEYKRRCTSKARVACRLIGTRRSRVYRSFCSPTKAPPSSNPSIHPSVILPQLPSCMLFFTISHRPSIPSAHHHPSIPPSHIQGLKTPMHIIIHCSNKTIVCRFLCSCSFVYIQFNCLLRHFRVPFPFFFFFFPYFFSHRSVLRPGFFIPPPTTLLRYTNKSPHARTHAPYIASFQLDHTRLTHHQPTHTRSFALSLSLLFASLEITLESTLISSSYYNLTHRNTHIHSFISSKHPRSFFISKKSALPYTRSNTHSLQIITIGFFFSPVNRCINNEKLQLWLLPLLLLLFEHATRQPLPILSTGPLQLRVPISSYPIFALDSNST